MATVLPNWGPDYCLNIGDSGFATLETVKAGDSYFNRATGQTDIYQFTNVYLKEFIKDKKSDKLIL